jgi:hypothetical protein
MYKIIAVTPAGRRQYLEILSAYIMRDVSIEEWHLWDNCRTEDDRLYITELARKHRKIKVVEGRKVDGSNRSINQFYQHASDPEAFYIKLDDDIVYLPQGFGQKLFDRAICNIGRYLWWSPIVINNSISSWILNYPSALHISNGMTAQAASTLGWRCPILALLLHRAFVELIRNGRCDLLKTPDFPICLSRFSINCIGFFGRDVQAIGEGFCPPNVDDEEWISAILPSRLQRYGGVVGDLQVGQNVTRLRIRNASQD